MSAGVPPSSSALPAALPAGWQNLLYRAVDFARAHPLWLILALGALLRLVAIDSRSLQYDDVFTIYLARRGPADIIAGTAADTMPPLFYILLHLWLMVSQSVWFIRLLPVLLNLATVALFYRLIARLLDEKSAAWAALLAAVSPLMIYHAQDVRMYALLLLAQVGYFYFFTRLFLPVGGPVSSRASWFWLVLCGAAALYTHNVALFALAAADFYLLARRDFKALLRLAAAQAVMVVVYLPWLLLLPGQIAKVQRAWTLPAPGVVEVLQAVLVFTASLPLPFPLLAAAAVIAFQGLVVGVLELRRVLRSATGHEKNAVLLLGCLLLVPPVLIFAASYLVKPIFVPRAFLAASLAYDGLLGFVIARAWRGGAGRLLAGAVLLTAALTLPSFYTYSEFPRSPYYSAARWLYANASAEALVVHDNKLSYFPMSFYGPCVPQVFVDDEAGSANDTFEPASQMAMRVIPQPDLQAAVDIRQDIYFVLFAQTITEYQAVGVSQHPALRWLDERFERAGEQQFNDLQIIHYRLRK